MSSTKHLQEHDYIGSLSSETTTNSVVSSDNKSSSCSSLNQKPNPSSSSFDHHHHHHHHQDKDTNNKNNKETELRLGLPGSESPERPSSTYKTSNVLSLNLKTTSTTLKRGFSDDAVVVPHESSSLRKAAADDDKKSNLNELSAAPASKAQVVGWPPIRSFRKNTMASNLAKSSDGGDEKSGSGCLYVKVSMDGAPYLRKVDLKTYKNYVEFSSALEKMFSCFTIGQCGSNGLPGREGLSHSRLTDLLHGSEYVLTYEDKDGDWMLVGDVPWEMFTDTCRRLRIMKGSEAIGLAPRAMEKRKSRN